jgi:hypothetical protein
MAIEKRSPAIEDKIGRIVYEGSHREIDDDLRDLRETLAEWDKTGMDTYRTLAEVELLRLVDKYRNLV